MIEVLNNTLNDFLKVFPILIFSILGAEIVSRFVHKKGIKMYMQKSKRGLLISAGIGFLTPGPLIAYLPALNSLRKKGLPLSYIATFITSNSFMGFFRIFIEVFYFNVYFFITRTMLAFIMSFSLGLIFRQLEKKKFFSPEQKRKNKYHHAKKN